MRRTTLLALVCAVLVASAEPALGNEIDPRTGSARRWKINTHLFAANKALADALDGKVTIPPYGEIPIAASAWRALRNAPAAYRAGVLAPDLFPDMYTGGWVLHSDTPNEWTADQWMRHVWSKARAWQDAGERDKVMAFAYGFLTHGAGDMWAHTYVNQKADGAWVTFIGPARSTALKHVVLEGYVGAHTPPTDLSLDVWPRFVANILIKDAVARQHMPVARHYKRWLDLYDWLGPQIDRAKAQMNKNIDNDAPYWMKCTVNPIPCAKKEQMEAWRLDINRGLRAMVDSSQSLGEALMHHETGEGIGAMTGWMKEWVPKMFGAHAIGEGASEMAEFMEWVGDPLAPINKAIMDEVQRFMKEEFPKYYTLYLAVKDPATQMDNAGFPEGTRQLVDQDMGIAPGADRPFDWTAFEPMYNTVILSKLILLDGDGLNELARRAGVPALFPPGEDTNVMLGVFRSMTQSYQWTGELIKATTRFGICGPENGEPLPPEAVCGIQPRQIDVKTASAGRRGSPLGGRANSTGTLGGTSTGGGFVFWQHPVARDKIFTVIFKGFGPGPGTVTPRDVFADLGPAPATVRAGARALRATSDQAELIREIVDVMRGKVSATARIPTAPAVQPAPGTPVRLAPGRRAPASGGVVPPPAATSGEGVINWGERCCAKDIAAIRAALGTIKLSSRSLQSVEVFRRMGRRATPNDLAMVVLQLERDLVAFEKARDAQAASAALAQVWKLSAMLVKVAAGA